MDLFEHFKHRKILNMEKTFFLRFQAFQPIKNAIPDHQEIESDKQSEEAAKVRNQGAERVGHHLLLSGDDWTVEFYVQCCHIWIRGRYYLRLSDQLKKKECKG